MYVDCSTTEDRIWIRLSFRVRERGLTHLQARRLAVKFRMRGHLARVLPDKGRWLVATYKPRRRAAGGRELAA